MRPVRKLTLMMAAIALLLFASQSARSDEQMIITPAAKLPVANAPGTVMIPPVIVEAGQVPAVPGIPAAVTFSADEYRRIYNSIPFSRAEYKANPNYRHDTAMEILTGNARTQTVVNHEHIHREPVRPTPRPTRPSRLLTPFSGYSYFYGNPWMRTFWF